MNGLVSGAGKKQGLWSQLPCNAVMSRLSLKMILFLITCFSMCIHVIVYAHECRSLQKSGESDPMDDIPWDTPYPMEYTQLWAFFLWVLGLELWSFAVGTPNSLAISVADEIF